MLIGQPKVTAPNHLQSNKDLIMNSIVRGFAPCFLALGLFCGKGLAQNYSQQIETAEPDHITARDLTSLAEAAYEVRQFEDNRMLYDKAVRLVEQRVQDLSGLDVVMDVKVKRVTYSEVLLSLPAELGAWFAILPPKSPPGTESLHASHRDYSGPPSTLLHNVLSAPQTIPIGAAVRKEDAIGLRKGDVIRITAKVNEIQSDVPTGRVSDTIVFLKDARVYYEDPEWWQKTGGVLDVQSIPELSDPERTQLERY